MREQGRRGKLNNLRGGNGPWPGSSGVLSQFLLLPVVYQACSPVFGDILVV